MKKALLIGLVVGILAAWSIPAMAIDWSGSGYINVMYAAARNGAVPGNNPFAANNAYLDEMSSWMFMRGRLLIKAQASPDLYGVFYFEMDSNFWGEGTTTRAGGSGFMGRWGADAVAVEIKHCYVDFRMPPNLPLWFRIGVQDVSLASKVLLSNDGAAVTATLKVEPIKMNVMFRYAKPADSDEFTAADGTEIYQFAVDMPLGPVTPQVYFMYNNVRYGANNLVAGNLDYEQLWWLGLNLKGKIGMGSVTIRPELDLVWSDGTGTVSGGNDVNYGSWLTRFDLAALINKLTVGMQAYYCMGRDWDDFTADNRDSTFQRPRPNSSGLAGMTSIHNVWRAGGYFMSSGGVGGPMTGNLPATYLVGAWWLGAYVEYQIFDWLKVGGAVSYIGDTEEDGDAIDRLSQNNGDADDDQSIGWEFCFGTEVKLYKNLSWNTAFGYLFAHKGLSLNGGVTPDDPWAFRSALMYRF
ncbi:MAG: hypothetical protein JXA50_03885 [Deltaproteobacteria bacterium]|nr:hypothetical protein [Deltaproteobacteria bacterium]